MFTRCGFGRHASAAFADPKRRLVVACVFNGMPGEARHSARVRDVFSAIYEDLELT